MAVGGKRMFGLTPEQIANIAGIAGIVSAVIAAIGVPLALRAWRDHLVSDLANPVVRERLAEALTAPGLVRVYERSLQVGLERLEGWMGGYGDLARGYGWCFAVAMGYAALFILLPWAATGSGTGLGALVLVAETASPWWLRMAALGTLGVAATLLYLGLRHEKRIEAWQNQRIRAMLQRSGAPASTRAVQWTGRGASFALVFGVLIGGRWLLGLELTSFYVAVAFAGAVLALSGLGLKRNPRWRSVSFLPLCR